MLKIKCITIFSIIGILIGYYFKRCDLIISLLLCIFCILLVYYILNKKYFNTYNQKKVYICYCIILVIFQIYTVIKYSNLDNTLDKYSENINNVYIGRIISYKKTTEYKNIYSFNISYVNNRKVNSNIYLYVPKDIYYNTNDKLVCNLELELPFESKNEGCFNNKLFLFSKNIQGYGHLKDVLYKESEDKGFLDKIYIFKENIVFNILNKFNKEVSGVLISIMFSNKQYLTKEIKDIFSNSNLSHVLVMSGSHLLYVITFLTLILNKLLIRKKKAVTVIVFIFYLFITSFSISILRSLLAYLISFIYMICNQKKNNIDSICICLLIFLIYNPLMLYNVSIILSFLSIFSIHLLYKKINNKLQYNLNNKNNRSISKIINLFSISLSISIIIFPAITIYFNKIYITSIFSSLFALPVLGNIIIFSFLYMFIYNIPIISNIFIFFLSVLLNILIIIAKFFSFIPFSNILVYRFNIIELILYYFTIFTAFINNKYYYIIKSKVKKILSKISKKVKVFVIMLSISLFIVIKYIDINTLKINFIDVGQGDSTLIRVNNKVILIDGGGNNSDFDVGEKTLMPYLLNKRIKTIDYIIISHFDIDHCRGLIYITNNFNVKNIVIAYGVSKSDEYYYFFNNIQNRNINIITVKQNDIISLTKNTNIHILSPIDNVSEDTENNLSIVLKLNYYNLACLFTGDIESKIEEKLIGEYDNLLKSDIIKIAHHGSKNSTSDAFLEKVNPKFSLIGVGKNNYGHPSDDVILKLMKKNIRIYRTDKNGEIKIQKYRNYKIYIKSTF